MPILKVRLICGKDLESKDTNGYSDPYCKLSIGSERKKSKIKKKNLDPVWDETFSFTKFNPSIDQLLIQVYDRDFFGSDDALGWCSVALTGLMREKEKLFDLPLQGVKSGKLHIGLTSIDFATDSQRQGSSFHGGGTGYESEGPSHGPGSSYPPSMSDSPTDWYLPPETVEVAAETELGKGAFGVVYKGIIFGKAVAIKKLNKQNFTNEVMEEFIKEVCVMCKIRHPNVTLFMGACTDPGHLAIVTELLPRGSLEKLLKDGSLSFFQKFAMAKDVVLAMNWLHLSQNILHLDLKPANLLVDDNWNVKLADFGLSCLKHNVQSGQLVGTPWFMAPEILLQQPYDEKADVYSFAIVLWTMYTNELLPYADRIKNLPQLIDCVARKGERPIIPKDCPAALVAVLKSCWRPDPKTRPSFQDLISSCEIDNIVLSEVFSPSQKLGRDLWESLCSEKVKSAVSWSDFLLALKSIIGMPKIPEIYEKCLKALLANDASDVTAEKFSQILEWVGPLQPGLPTLERIVNLLQRPDFFGYFSGKQAETALRNKPPGTYLLRFSTTQAGDYAVSAVTEAGTLTHYKLQKLDGGKYLIGETKHESLFHALRKPPIQLQKVMLVPCDGSPYRDLFNQDPGKPCVYEHVQE